MSPYITLTRIRHTVDLVIVMGTSLVVYPFAGLVNEAEALTPRLLINRQCTGPFQGFARDRQDKPQQEQQEATGTEGGEEKEGKTTGEDGNSSSGSGNGSGFGDMSGSSMYRDAMYVGDCDDGAAALCAQLGWGTDLDRLCHEADAEGGMGQFVLV
jgi:NAD-dependent deacetylase sirtuin 2